MSMYYNIKTSATIKEVAQTEDLEILGEVGHYYIMDKFENMLSCTLGDNDEIIRLTCFGKNDPDYILYKLVTEHKSLFLDEYNDLVLMHNAVSEGRLEKDGHLIDYSNSYEDFTISFMEYYEENYGNMDR